MKKRANLKERICALALAVLMPFTSVMPHVTLVAGAEDVNTLNDVTFTIKDNTNAAIEGAQVTIYEGDAAGELEKQSTNASGEAVFKLDDSIDYQFKVTKERYIPVERKKVSDLRNGDKVDVTLDLMGDIEIAPADVVVVEKDKMVLLEVSNAVAGVDYTWKSADPSIATVDETTGNVTGVTRGNVDITVSGNGKQQTKKVVVKETPAMTITATPNKGPLDDDSVVTSVTLEAQLPQDADGTVTFYQESADDSNNKLGTEASVNSGIASLKADENANFTLIGTKTFWAEYSGSDTNYYLGVRASTQGVYLKKLDLKLSETEVTKNYGDASFKVPEVDSGTVDGTGRDKDALTYDSDNKDAVTVDNDGNLTIVGVGTAKISVTIPASDTYISSTAYYTVKVEPKALGTIQVNKFDWQAVSQVYDGAKDIDIQGKLTRNENSEVLGDDIISISAKAEIEKADAGEYDKCTIGDVSASGNDNYTFTVDKTAGNSVTLTGGKKITINKRPVYIQIEKKFGDYESKVPYGKRYTEIQDIVIKDNKIVLAGDKGDGRINMGAEEGLLKGDNLNLADYASIKLEDTDYFVEDTPYPAAIQPEVTKKDAGNYEVRVENDNKYFGRLLITQEKKTDAQIRDLVSVNEDAGGVYTDSNTKDVWVRGNARETLKFSLKNNPYYEQIMVSSDGTTYVEFPNQTGAGLQFNEDKDADKNLKLYLKNSVGGEKTRTKSDNTYSIKVDAENPTAVFTGIEAELFSDSMQVPFTKFTNKNYTVTVRASDGGSGVASFETCVIKVTEDGNIITDIVNAIDQGNWNQHTGVTTAGETVSSQGNHIVLARIRDNVGNEAVYTSNGLVFETNNPKVAITVNNGQAIGQVSCNDTVPYTISVQDLDAVTKVNSGIDRIEVEVTDNGNRVGDSAALNTDKKVVDSYSVTSEDIDKIIGAEGDNTPTLAYLSKRASFTLNGILTVKKYHTNKITIHATAFDKAGNKTSETVENLCLDNILPKVEVGYDKYDASAKHYFQSREMTVKYTERNFAEELLSFDVEADGVKKSGTAEDGRLTLAELNAIAGIEMTKDSDTQADVTNADDYIDNRVITYKIKFSQDGAYKILPHIKDTAENKNSDIAYEKDTNEDYDGNELFVIDSLEPKAEVSYQSYNEDDSVYYNSRVMTLKLTERNFDAGLLSFDLEINGEAVKGTAGENRLTLGELSTIANLEAGAVRDSEGNIEDINSHTDNRTLEYDINFKAEGCYKLIPHIKDKAGNADKGVTYTQASAANETFYIDDTVPEIHVAYNDDKIGVVNEKFFNKQRTMTITYKERNFLLEKATFKLTVDGEEKEVDYDGLKEKLGADAITEIEDNEKDVDTRKHTDNREIKFTIIFGNDNEDHDYRVMPEITDLAGKSNQGVADKNQLVETGEEFTVDMVKPQLAVKYYAYENGVRTDVTADITANEQDSMYKNSNVEAEIVITERNFAVRNQFSEEELEITGAGVDVKGNPVTFKDGTTAESFFKEQNTQARITDNWKDKIDDARTPYMKTNTLIFSGEANYTFNMSYTDEAGNTAALADTEYQFTVDKTEPSGEISISGGKETFINKLLNLITFNVFRNETTVINMNSEDATSPFVQQYYIDDPDSSKRNVDSNGQFEALTKDELDHISGWVETDTNQDGTPDGYTPEQKNQTYQLGENTKAVPYMYVIDKAGNKAYYNANGAIDDRIKPAKPEITVTIQDPAASINDSGKEIFNSDVSFDIKVIDPIPESGAYSGLANVYYKIIKDQDIDHPTQEEVFKEEFEPLTKRVQTWKKSLVINGKNNNSNDIVIEVTAEDNAGNKTTETRELAIDMRNPEIDVSYDNNDVANSSYFKADRVMTITYTERNFEEELLTFDVVTNGENKGDPATNGRVTLNELKKLDGITVESGPSDSQEGTDFKKLTDKRTNTYTIRFDGGRNKDMDYIIVPYIEDAAARSNVNNEKTVTYAKGTKAEDAFTVDKTFPIINVVYKSEGKVVSPGKTEEKRLYKNTVITAEITVTERNFSPKSAFSEEPKQMQLSYEAVDADKNPVEVENYTESAGTRGKWTSEGYVRTQVLTFNVDANYKLGLTYKDLAGNEVSYGKHYFTYDKTAPTGTITAGKFSWSQWADMIFFGIFNKGTQEVSMISGDATAGVASTQYYKYIPDEETRGNFKGLTIEELNKLTDWVDGNTTSVDPNEQAVIYEKVVDKAGNVSFITLKQGIIADNVKPQAPEIKITMAEPSQGIYSGDVPFSIDVTDPVSGGTYSGLENVTYQIFNNGVETQSHSYHDEELSDGAARVQSLHHELVVDAAQNNSNHVTIKVTASDYAGNSSEAVKDIKIDTVDPKVRIEYDLNNPSNERYYNAVRTATVYVTERNFDPDAVDFTITNTDGTMPSISGWDISPLAGESDEAVNSCTVTFAADGDYTITMNCTDRAGRRSNYSQVDDFTIDRTVPTISVGFDNNSAANAGYYDKPRTATVTVNEHNFNGAEVQAAISASLQSQGITAPGLNGWSNSGDTHTATIYFGTDGDYSFTINYTDLAGNAAEAHTQEKFTVDQTKPEIDIFDIVDKSANNAAVEPGVKYSDVNYDSAGVKITIKGPKHSERTITGARTSVPNGESIKMADFEHKESVDDVYTLTAQVADLAGNVDEKSVMFSVNRFGSNYIFGDSTKAFLDKYYSNEEQDLIVTEINVDTLTHNGISYGLDGELVNLEKGTDYTVKESGNEASWKSYQYTVKAANFEQEGLYNITIDSTDRAKNEVNNKVKDANIEFVIDKTKPTVVITGVEDDGQYRTNNRDITIHVADNVAMERLDVSVNGTETKAESYDAETIQKQKGEVPFALASSSNWQEITATATDAAGNTADTSEIRVLITSNMLVQFYRNTPLVVGSSVGLAALAAVVVFLISRKKKTNQKES